MKENIGGRRGVNGVMSKRMTINKQAMAYQQQYSEKA